MGNIIEYKGYYAKVEFDAESETFRGKIERINDYIDFETKYSLQGSTQGRYLTGGVPPVRFSM